MCGICCVIAPGALPIELTPSARAALARRGPDAQADQRVVLEGDGGARGTLLACGCVLHLRGPLTGQPLCAEDTGDILLWNGEAYAGLDGLGPQSNDGALLLDALTRAASGPKSADEAILAVLGRLRGPWAFVFLQKRAGVLWYGRDCLGRRSLVRQGPAARAGDAPCSLTLASGALGLPREGEQVWEEVPAAGVYRLDLAAWLRDPSLAATLCPWRAVEEGGALVRPLRALCTEVPVGDELPPPRCGLPLAPERAARVARLIAVLEASVRARTMCQYDMSGREHRLQFALPRVGILFSVRGLSFPGGVSPSFPPVTRC